MAQRSGLFDSTEIVETIDGYPRGNRAETADFFAKYFSNFIDNGVFTEVSTSFQVLTAGGMNVTVKKGSCFINGYMAFDDEDEVFTLTAGHTHWFVQRAHLITGGDITKTWVVDAAEGELPLRDGTYYDLLIAKVVIPAGANSITDEMITDYRYDKTVCGAVTSLKPAVVPTLPDDVLKYVSKGLFRTVGGTSVDVGNAKIETSSYVGTGTPPTLTFSFAPKMVIITANGKISDVITGGFGGSNVENGHDNYNMIGLLFSNGKSIVFGKGAPIYLATESSNYTMFICNTLNYNSVTFNDNTVTWSHNTPISGFSAKMSGSIGVTKVDSAQIEHYNFYRGCHNITYNYIAIG